jgi:CubicO group peptidase (beta-lactamase class C family)
MKNPRRKKKQPAMKADKKTGNKLHFFNALGTLYLKKSAFFFVFLLLSLFSSNPSIASFKMKLEQYFNDRFLQDDLSGRLIVAEGDQVILNKTFGPDIKENSQFIIASVTKHMTAAALLRCVERKLLKLDEPIGTYLNIQSPWAMKVTPHHLLTHTSGLADHTADWDLHKTKPHTLKTVLDFLEQTPVPLKENEFGKIFRYNNTGYFLLGALVEKVTGEPLSVFLEEEFFIPLQMTQTFLPLQGNYQDLLKDPRAKNMVEGFYSNKVVNNLDVSFIAGAGGVVSSADDMLRWAQALFIDQTVVSKDSLDMMLKPYQFYTLEDLQSKPANYYYHLNQKLGSTVCSYGYGLRKIPFAGTLIQYAHPGRVDGFVADFRYIPTKGLGNIIIVAFTNRVEPIHEEKGRLWQRINELVEIVHQEETQAEKKARVS